MFRKNVFFIIGKLQKVPNREYKRPNKNMETPTFNNVLIEYVVPYKGFQI